MPNKNGERAYEVDEACEIFYRIRAHADPLSFQQERQQAVRDLASAVASAAERAGLQVDRKGDEVIFSPQHGVTVTLLTVGTERLGVRVASFREHQPRSWAWPKLEYQAASKMFVSEAEDTYWVPKPGERRSRRGAVAVVAELIATELSKLPTGRS